MPTDTDLIVDGLLRWWQRRFPMARGQRNASIYKLAAALNNYGIPYTRALEECLRYADPTGPDPFTDREITRTVESAYRSTEHAIKEWGGGHDGHTPRPSYMPRFTPRLTPAQTKAVEDKLAEEFRARFAWKPWGMEPQQPAAEVGAMAAPATLPQPPPSAPPIIKTRAEAAIERMAEKNPAINLLVDLLQLDVAGATVRKLTTT